MLFAILSSIVVLALMIMKELTDEQWLRIRPLFPRKDLEHSGAGRPRQLARDVLEGILWVLRTGAHWHDLPDCFPSYQTCHRRLQQWERDGLMEQIIEALAKDLEARGNLGLTGCFIDGSFAPAKKGGLELAKLSVVKAPKSWTLQTAMVFQSPFPFTVLLRMKSHLLKKPLKNVSFRLCLPA